MIEALELRRTFGPVVALDGVSFVARPGEILGLLGPNGAGKSTCVKILTGLIKPTGGTARVAGFDVVTAPLEVKRRIGYVPESAAIYETLTPDEYLELVGSLHHLAPDVLASRRDELIELFDLEPARSTRLGELSKGTRQKVLVLAALVHKPEVVCLDEALNGLDVHAAVIVKDLLRGLARQGRTILFSSHVLDVVERVCTRIVVIDRGVLVAEGTVAELVARAPEGTLEAAFRMLTGHGGTRDFAETFLGAT